MSLDVQRHDKESLPEIFKQLELLSRQGRLSSEDEAKLREIVNRYHNWSSDIVGKTKGVVEKDMALSIDALRSDPQIRYLISTSFPLNNPNSTDYRWTYAYYRKNWVDRIIPSQEEGFWLVDDVRSWTDWNREPTAYVIKSWVLKDWTIIAYIAFWDNRFDNRKNLSWLAVKIPKDHPNKEKLAEYLISKWVLRELFKRIMPRQFVEKKEWDGNSIWDRLEQREKV